LGVWRLIDTCIAVGEFARAAEIVFRTRDLFL
jgi:hypothetical protein